MNYAHIQPCSCYVKCEREGRVGAIIPTRVLAFVFSTFCHFSSSIIHLHRDHRLARTQNTHLLIQQVVSGMGVLLACFLPTYRITTIFVLIPAVFYPHPDA